MRKSAVAAATVMALTALGFGGSAQAADPGPAATKSSAQTTTGELAAQAQGSAWNIKTLKLRFPADRGAESCQRKTIRLAADTYRWETVDSEGHNSRRIYLAAGKYRWVDCIHAWERAGGYRVYRHQSALQQVRTGGWVHLPDNWLQNSLEPGYVTKWYGSKLTQL